MPTVKRWDGLRVVIYPNDHRPADVHVIGADGEAVFLLHCPDGPPTLRENYGFTRPFLNSIAVVLGGMVRALCIEWKAIHGDDRHGN